MKYLPVLFPEDMLEELRRQAYLQKRSMADIVREAVGEYLEKLDGGENEIRAK